MMIHDISHIGNPDFMAEGAFECLEKPIRINNIK